MNTRIIIPIVAAVLALVTWLLTRESYNGHKNQYLPPLGVFIGAIVLGQIGAGVFQGMRDANKPKGKGSGSDPKRKQ